MCAQSLTQNELREKVILRADGGMRSGRDVMLAAALGADEFGFGTVAMIATGCIMARVCHTNNCPVGVASQREELRARFPGAPADLVRPANSPRHATRSSGTFAPHWMTCHLLCMTAFSELRAACMRGIMCGLPAVHACEAHELQRKDYVQRSMVAVGAVALP